MPKIIVGVDEAGRGPVLGPLVMVALAFRETDQKKLQWMGIKDSKLLKPQSREHLFDRIHELVVDFRIEVIEPDAIDLSLNDSKTNLNWLEADTTARLVSELTADKVIVDCPSPNITAYRQYFQKKLPATLRKKMELFVEHKADLKHLPVAAASIVAKVIRDRYIERLKNEIGIDFGSGYLTDPKTQKFLAQHYNTYPEIFRKSWQPYKKICDKALQKQLPEFDG